MTDTPAIPDARQVLRQNSALRALWTAGLATNLGGVMQDTAGAWTLAAMQGGSPMLVSWMQAAASLPFFFLALPGGALADVVDRRRLLLVAQGWRFLAAAALALAALTGHLNAGWLIGATFAMSLGASFTLPGWQASYPDVVPREQVPVAMRLAGMAGNLARGLGPALAGLLVGSLGSTQVFVVNALLMGVALALLFAHRPARQAAVLPTERLVGAMKAALRYVWHAPAIESLLVRIFAFVFCASAPMALVPLVARQRLHLSGTEFGLALAVMGLGGVACSVFLLPRICSRYRMDAVVTASSLALALASLTLGLVRNALELNLALFVLGGSVMSAMASLNLGAQVAMPDWIRGRASSVYLLVVQGTFAVGALCWGYLAESIGVPSTLLAAAAGAVLSLGLGWFLPLPRLATMNLSTSQHWPAFQLVTTLLPDDGPVLVQIDYEIDPAQAAPFRAAMRELRSVRLRDGGMRWMLLDDLGQPGHYRESFLVESWSDHLRQVEHATVDDAAIEQRARTFLRPGTEPTLRHFLVASAGARTGA